MKRPYSAYFSKQHFSLEVPKVRAKSGLVALPIISAASEAKTRGLQAEGQPEPTGKNSSLDLTSLQS